MRGRWRRFVLGLPTILSLTPRGWFIPHRYAPLLPPPGHWHTKGFTAAIVPASRIAGSRDAQTDTEAFLYVAVEALIDALQ